MLFQGSFKKWCSSGVVSTSLSRTIIDFMGFSGILQDTAVADRYYFIILDLFFRKADCCLLRLTKQQRLPIAKKKHPFPKAVLLKIRYETIKARPAIFEIIIIFFRTVRSKNSSFILLPQIYTRNG